MLSLSAKIRKTQGKKVKTLLEKGILPGVLYGPKIKNENIEVDLKEFNKAYQEAGESTLISIEIDKKKYLVLIHDIKLNPLTDRPIHVDFYQPSLEKEIEVKIPVILEGEPEAVKNLGGTLIKNIAEVEVRALPQNLPKEIKINIERLKTFEDHILIKDLRVAEEVKILRDPGEIVAQVTPPEKVEEELEKPIEEKVEEVEKVEKEKKEEAVEEKEEKKPASPEAAPSKEEKRKEKKNE